MRAGDPLSDPVVSNPPLSSTDPWSIARVLKWAAEDFARRGSESPRLDAELLLCAVLAVDRVRLILDSSRPLSDVELAAYRELIRRRRRGEPVAYILGLREFYGHAFRVDARALVPRPDTEALVDVALTRTRARSLYGRALDLCTGSGCVAISIALSRPTWKVTGVDISAAACNLARENAERLGATWSTRWTTGDLFSALGAERRFELITANPPYIPRGEIAGLAPDIRDFEPHLALDGGDDGLLLLRRIAAGAGRYLSAGGVLALEVGHDQAERVSAILSAEGYARIERQRDYGGHERVVSAVYGPP